MTINQFIEDYKLRKDALDGFGLTYYVIRTHGDTDFADLPEKYQTMFLAAMARYGVQYE